MERPGLKAAVFIALLAFPWAAPTSGAAHSVAFRERKTRARFVSEGGTLVREVSLPLPVHFRESRGRGLLVTGWIDGAGPYTFAIDTGAGTTLIRSELLSRAGLSATSGRKTQIGGLSHTTSVSGQQTFIKNLALGERTNVLPSHHRALIVTALPPGVDGVLDPTEAYAPLGYVIDMPNRELRAFDTTTNRLDMGNEPVGGTVVRWIRENGGKRPFVRLGDGRLALIDTGSGFGLAVTQSEPFSGRNHRTGNVRDLGGGVVESRRVAPTTVTIGSLVLRKVPTDVLIGVSEDAPVILGRDVLAPFRIIFDPVRRLIEIAPSAENRSRTEQ